MDVGERVGNYRIDGEIGANEYRATHVLLPRRASLRVTDQPRMLREPLILEALQHPGIVRVYECGIHEGRAWFATELVESPSIRQLMAPNAIDRIDAIALLRDLAEILAHACQRGVIHCGVRPERVLLTGGTRGFPLCVADWSEARTHDAKPQPLVATEESWPYASPELACGDPIDDRADVFALGVIAYELLTSHRPFEQGFAALVDDGTVQHVPTEVRCPDAPPELTRLVDSMLAYDRWDRPSTAEALRDLVWLADALRTPTAANPPSTGMLRIRRPRWTPAGFGPKENSSTSTSTSTSTRTTKRP